MHGGRTMKEYSEAFIGFDTAKKKHAVAIADVGREGEIRYLGEIDSSPLTIERMIPVLVAVAGRIKHLPLGRHIPSAGIPAVAQGEPPDARLPADDRSICR